MVGRQLPSVFASGRRAPRIVVIRGVRQGAFFARYLAGARQMAGELSLELTVRDAEDGDMAGALRAAMERGVDAAVLSSGSLAALGPSLEDALGAGIQLVGFDMTGEDARVPALEQDDMWIGFLLARTLAGDCDGRAQVLYLNPGGYAPLEKRHRGWEAYTWRFPGLREVARAGAVTADTEADTEDAVLQLLQAHPDITAILAMWDELARGAVRAVLRAGAGGRIRVYSVDVSDEDVRMMSVPGSPWVATVATDASNLGRVAVRAAAALIAGERVPRYLLVEPQLVTQEFLRTNGITDLDTLVRALPTLGDSRLLWCDWMERLLARNGLTKPMATLAPERLISLSRELREAEAALRAEDRRKDEFLAVLSHELRNPLAPIRNSLYVLRRAPAGSDPSRRALAVIDRQTTHLTRLVDDLLDVTRIARGKIRIRREPVDLTDLVRRTLDDHRESFEARGVRLDSRVEEEPLWLSADPIRVAQIVGNLLANAAKFTPEGGRVELTLERQGGLAVLRVRDTGVGIEPDVLERVFEPFAQGTQTLDRSQGGLGLGLALVKGLTELHGGSVVAASEGPGRGAELTVRLPLSAQASTASHPGAEAPGP